MMNNLIEEVDFKKYAKSIPQNKLMSASVPNYYYKINLKEVSYYFNSNASIKRGEAKYFKESNRALLAYEDFVYIFDYIAGNIALALKLNDYFSRLIYVDDFAILIGEFHVYQIEIKAACLYRIEIASDIITEVEVKGKKIIVSSFDEQKFQFFL